MPLISKELVKIHRKEREIHSRTFFYTLQNQKKNEDSQNQNKIYEKNYSIYILLFSALLPFFI